MTFLCRNCNLCAKLLVFLLAVLACINPALSNIFDDYYSWNDEFGHYARDASLEARAAVNNFYSLSGGLYGGDFQFFGPKDTGGYCVKLLTDNRNPNSLMVATQGSGIWQSLDRGTSWKRIAKQVRFVYVNDLCRSESNPDIIYATFGPHKGSSNTSTIVEELGRGLARSSDNGITWEVVNDSELLSFPRALAVAPDNPNDLWLGTDSDGLLHSVDGGKTWVTAISGGEFNGIKFQPGNSNVILACGSRNGLYRSINHGTSWKQVSSGGYQHTSIEISSSSPNVVYYLIYDTSFYYCALYRSDDSGATFKMQYAAGDEDTIPIIFGGIWVDPTNPNVLLCTSGAYKSTDGGKTFTTLFDYNWSSFAKIRLRADGVAIFPTPVSAPGFDGVAHADVFVPAYGGVYVGTQPATMTPLSNFALMPSAPGAWNCNDFYFDEQSQNSFLKAGERFAPFCLDMTRKTSVFNQVPLTRVLPGTATDRMIFAKSAGLYESSIFGGSPRILATNAYSGIDRIDAFDGVVSNGFITLALGLNVVTGSVVNRYVGLYSGPANALLISDFSQPPGARATCIRFQNGPAGNIWLGTEDGVISKGKISNGKAIWTVVEDNVYLDSNGQDALPDRSVLAIGTSKNSSDVYVGLSGWKSDNLWVSSDEGKSWRLATGSGPLSLPPVPINALLVHPANPNVVYVGTELGLFVTTNGGATFQLADPGVGQLPVRSLRYQDKMATVGVGYLGGSIWMLDASEYVTQDFHLDLGQGYTGALDQPEVRVEISDQATGVLVDSWTGRADTAGLVKWRPVAPPGTYRVRVKASHWLAKAQNNVRVPGHLGQFSLINGDLNGDNYVGTDDYLLLNANFDSESTVADLTGDDFVNADDYIVLIGGFDTYGD